MISDKAFDVLVVTAIAAIILIVFGTLIVGVASSYTNKDARDYSYREYRLFRKCVVEQNLPSDKCFELSKEMVRK